MIDTPHIAQSPARLTAVIHITTPREKIREVMGPGIQELMATIAAQGIAPAGPLFSRHLRIDPAIFDFEISVPVSATVTPAGRVRPSQLPAVTVARTIYHGPYEGLGEAWGEFCAWLTANGLRPAADLWECYLAGPESSPDPSQWRTELNRPLLD